MFRRNRGQADESATSSPTDAVQDSIADAVEAPAAKVPQVIGTGPWDITEEPEDGVVRLDFGSLKIPGVEGMNVNLELDEESQTVVAITIVINEGGLQLQPFAAPRNGEFWSEVREELAAGITSSGGVADVVEGSLGDELRATVPVTNEDGEAATQQVRFVGFDGPRWLLRGVFLGAAAVDDRAAEVFEDIFTACVVTRGNQPMAPGEMLPLQLPEDAVAEEVEGDDDADGRPPLDPFERGPEITEIR
ncbi:MAG: DUF3710 domain-containing protein [Actinobacteria bacterium]|nr:DUF3710 domain-containing protein [Actinomycetota bacterium]